MKSEYEGEKKGGEEEEQKGSRPQLLVFHRFFLKQREGAGRKESSRG